MPAKLGSMQSELGDAKDTKSNRKSVAGLMDESKASRSRVGHGGCDALTIDTRCEGTAITDDLLGTPAMD